MDMLWLLQEFVMLFAVCADLGFGSCPIAKEFNRLRHHRHCLRHENLGNGLFQPADQQGQKTYWGRTLKVLLQFLSYWQQEEKLLAAKKREGSVSAASWLCAC